MPLDNRWTAVGQALILLGPTRTWIVAALGDLSDSESVIELPYSVA